MRSSSLGVVGLVCIFAQASCSGGKQGEAGDGTTASTADSAGEDTSSGTATDDDTSDDSPAGGGSSSSDDPGSDGSAGGDAADSSDDASTDSSGDAANSEEYLAPSGVAVRLTQAELDNALRDVLGDTTSPASSFLSEDEFSPFDNDAARQTVSRALIDSLHVLSEDVAVRAVTDADARAEWMPCEPASATDAACFDQTAQTLGRLFFRRAIADDELPAYRVLLDFAAEQDDFFVAIELLIQAFIQDPEFLYRVERGSPSGTAGVLDLSDQEIATRLSILLLGTTPDAALLSLAEQGMLTASDSRRSAAADLLGDARAKAQLFRFHGMWLGYRTLPHDGALNAEFQGETEALIDRVVFSEPSGYLDLFRSGQTYLTSTLAQHYGLPEPGGGEGWVTYPDDSGRAGILGHGSVLSAFSKFSDTSPTQRGIFVRTRLMCLEVPPPPPTIDVDQPPEEVEGGCKVERYTAHREQPGCAECHSLFDPIGIGLENFDLAGRFRETDDDNPDCAITESGDLPGYGEFSGPAELSGLLLDHQLVAGCFSQYYLQFAWAKTGLSAGEVAFSSELAQALEADGRLDEWLLDLIEHESFAKRLDPVTSGGAQ